MFNQIQLLVYDMNSLKESRNPIKKLFSLYIKHQLKKTIIPLSRKSKLDINYLFNLCEFISIYSNDIFTYKDLGNLKIISTIYYNSELIEIVINQSHHQQITVNYYKNGNIYKGRYMKLYRDAISIHTASNTDSMCVLLENIIRDRIEDLLKDYINNERNDGYESIN